MEWENYDFVENLDRLTYDFHSEGPKGEIIKKVQFQHVPKYGRNFYNLLFGDYNEETTRIDDRVISNNKDRGKVLRTVAKIVGNFITLNPIAIVHIKGSSGSRSRLYRMGISSIWLQVREQYEILGEYNKTWIPFKKGINYEAFLVFKKIA